MKTDKFAEIVPLVCLNGRKWHELSCQKKSSSNFMVQFHEIANKTIPQDRYYV